MIATATSIRDKMLSMDNFGAWLLNELEERNMTQSELARLAGLSRGTLSNLISGTRGRGPDSIEAIARALKLPPDQVFRVAGLLPPKRDVDEETEELNHLLDLLTPDKRKIAKSILNALIDGPAQVVPAKKPRSAKAKGSA